MSDIWIHPGFQAGVVPGVVSLILFFAFIRARQLLGFSVVIAFLATVALTTGFTLSPLTSTRKILIVAMVAPFIGLLFDSKLVTHKISRVIAPVLGLAALWWIIWPYVNRADVSNGWLIGIGLSVFVAWFVYWFYRIADHSIFVGAPTLVSAGFGTGISALLGASALLGQWGIAFGAAGLSAILVAVTSKKHLNAGSVFALSSGLVIAMAAVAAFVYAKLPWYVLPVLALIPVLSHIPFNESSVKWKRLGIVLATTAVAASAAIVLTWQAEGDIPI